jgi:hypothetical protein
MTKRTNMTRSELYKLWAPDESIWSNWAKPVLFADSLITDQPPEQSTDWSSANVDWAPAADSGTAIVLDLPGPGGVWFGMALSRRGYRPVPLYNGVRGPALETFSLVKVDEIISALQAVEETLLTLKLPPAALPVFLLDSNRLAGGEVALPGNFDNRWSIFPQDFPSANLLLYHGIHSVVLAQDTSDVPQDDLAHVLVRWQEAGIQILTSRVYDKEPPTPVKVARPFRFRSLWYAALVVAGLRRNSTGGFGATAPDPSSGGGYG